MSEAGDLWRDVRAHSRTKRQSNREQSAAALTAAGLVFESKNGGAHLILWHHTGAFDFWPGTGLYIKRGSGKKKRGVRNLIRELKS